jgi:hypothetical protein
LIQKAKASANSSWIRGDIILVRLDLVDDAAAQQANHEDGAATTQYTEVELTDAHAHRNSLVALSRTLWQTLNLDEQFVKHSIHEGRGTFRALNCITNFSGIEPPEIVTPFGFKFSRVHSRCSRNCSAQEHYIREPTR